MRFQPFEGSRLSCGQILQDLGFRPALSLVKIRVVLIVFAWFQHSLVRHAAWLGSGEEAPNKQQPKQTTRRPPPTVEIPANLRPLAFLPTNKMPHLFIIVAMGMSGHVR